jgi:hypothetical protein
MVDSVNISFENKIVCIMPTATLVGRVCQLFVVLACANVGYRFNV